MIEESTRPLRDGERALLEDLRRAPSSGGAPLGALLTFLLVLGTLLILAPASWQYGVRSLVPALVAGLAAAAVFARLRRAHRRDPWYARLDRDLAEGLARESTCQVVDAIRVEEFEDEGSQYYLRLRDDRVLFLAGQYLYEPEEEGRFPRSEVSVVRAPHTGTVLDLRCEGAPVAVSGVRAPFDMEDHRAGRVPEDGQLVDVPFESLRPPRSTG